MTKACAVSNGLLEPCASLDRAIEGLTNDVRKGLTFMVVHRIHDNEPLTPIKSGVVLRSGDFNNRRGVLLNYCPFCGKPIGHQFTHKEDAQSADT